jgi:hypothetical protein
LATLFKNNFTISFLGYVTKEVKLKKGFLVSSNAILLDQNGVQELYLLQKSKGYDPLVENKEAYIHSLFPLSLNTTLSSNIFLLETYTNARNNHTSLYDSLMHLKIITSRNHP